jgi:hypothetical protein
MFPFPCDNRFNPAFEAAVVCIVAVALFPIVSVVPLITTFPPSVFVPVDVWNVPFPLNA